jgi:hypothetical protein
MITEANKLIKEEVEQVWNDAIGIASTLRVRS